MKVPARKPDTVKENFKDLLITEVEAAILESSFEKFFLQSSKMGWHKKSCDPCRQIALIHSEISEALEGIRRGKKDDHLPQYDAVIVELADAVIRIGDLACALGYENFGRVIAEKHEYNQGRPDHQEKNRKKKGGKQF